MPTITKPYGDFVNAVDVADATKVNSQMNTIYNAVNGGLDVANVPALGDVTTLTTNAKNTAVAAINEINSNYPISSIYRQALINSNFDIWQGGTSLAIGSGYFADQWVLLFNATSATGTISQQPFALGQTAVPNNPKFFMRINPTALNACTSFTLYQPIEGVQNFSGQNVSFSFWAKADTAQTITAQINQNFGTGGSPSAGGQSPSVSFALTTAWQKLTGTILVPIVSGKTLGTNGNDHIELFINLPTTGVYSIDIAQVQLNTGNIALPYQPRDYEDELRKCQRFYETGIVRVRVMDATSTVVIPYSFTTTKRATPTITGHATFGEPNTNKFSIMPIGAGIQDITATFVANARL